MRKLLLTLSLMALVMVAGCKNGNPTGPVIDDDPWQRYPDGTPGVVDLRL